MLLRSWKTRRRYDALTAAITAGAPIDVRADVQLSPAASDLTDGAVMALCAAAVEALRNVQRHSGADSATLRVRAHGGGVIVEIADSGRGFRADEQALSGVAGFGIRHSIIDRMREAGGDAEIVSGHRGTTVRLTWMPPATNGAGQLSETWRRTMDLAADAHTLLRMALPMLVAMLWIAIRNSDFSTRDGHERTLLIGLITGLTVSFVSMLALLTRRAPQWWHLTAWSGGAASAIVVGALLVAPPDRVGFGAWYVAFATMPLAFLAYFSPPRALPLLVIPSAAVLLVGLLSQQPGGAWAVATAVNGLVPIVLANVMGSALRSARTSKNAQQGRLRAAETLNQRRTTIDADRRRRLRRTVETVLPFLESVATGELSPRESSVRVRANILGHESRDELYVPEFFEEELRDEVSQFRARGGALTLRAGLLPGPGSRPSHRVLEFLITQLNPVGTRVTVSRVEPDGTLVRVVPGLTDAQVSRLVECWAAASPTTEADDLPLGVTGDEYSTSVSVPRDIPHVTTRHAHPRSCS